jgi:epoxide hydrolase
LVSAQRGLGQPGQAAGRGHVQADRHRHRFLIVEQQRQQGRAHAQPVATRRARCGVHRVAEIPQPVDVPAHRAQPDAEPVRELMTEWQQRASAYMQVQGTRPQTIGQALTDSPAGQLAWIVEKFQEWTDPAATRPEDAVDRDRILTDVSICWFTATAGSAAHTYYERFNDPAMWAPRERSTVPTAVAVFTTDIAVRPFASRLHNVVRWTEFRRGGHFAALEAPDLLTADLREFFRNRA